MNWFERHLNWTAVIIPILGCTLGFMLGEIYMCLFSNYVYHILLPGEFGFLATVTLSSIGVTWVLRKKNRNLTMLLFSLPVFIVAVIAQIMTIEYYTYEPGNPAISLAVFIASVLWITGWIVLLLLKSQPKEEVNIILTQETSKIARHVGLLTKPFQLYPKLVYLTLFTITALIIIFGIISGNSYIGRNCSYITYSDTVTSSSLDITFSFEYPQCFYRMPGWPPEGDDSSKVFLWFDRDKRSWFTYDSGAWLNVEVGSIEDFTFSSTMLATEKAISHLSYAFGYDHEIDVLETRQVIVAGIPADYVTLNVSKREDYHYMHMWGMARFVCFEYKDLVWVIWIVSKHEGITQHEQYFNHVLETFTITITD